MNRDLRRLQTSIVESASSTSGTAHRTTWPEADLSPGDMGASGLVQRGQVWLVLAWKEEGAGNMVNGPVCRTVMDKTVADLPVQITPYHSALTG